MRVAHHAHLHTFQSPAHKIQYHRVANTAAIEVVSRPSQPSKILTHQGIKQHDHHANTMLKSGKREWLLRTCLVSFD